MLQDLALTSLQKPTQVSLQLLRINLGEAIMII